MFTINLRENQSIKMDQDYTPEDVNYEIHQDYDQPSTSQEPLSKKNVRSKTFKVR